MFTIRDLQLEPGRFHYITDLKFLSHASVTTLYSINLGLRSEVIVTFIFPDTFRTNAVNFITQHSLDVYYVTCINNYGN